MKQKPKEAFPLSGWDISMHACKTGDCPHEKQSECDEILKREERRFWDKPDGAEGSPSSIRVAEFFPGDVILTAEEFAEHKALLSRTQEKLVVAVVAIEFYANAPCSRKVLKAAPRFRSIAQEALTAIKAEPLESGGE